MTRRAAANSGTRRQPLPDHIRPDLAILFVGINPGLRSAALGHHFAGRSNRFWRLLHESGLAAEPLGFEDDWRLPSLGYGLTNLVDRPTRGVDALGPDELSAGRSALERKIARHRPRHVALVGITVWRALFGRGGGPVAPGPRPERLGGAPVFVLPNPSGRNAHYSYARMLEAFTSLRRSVAR